MITIQCPNTFYLNQLGFPSSLLFLSPLCLCIFSNMSSFSPFPQIPKPLTVHYEIHGQLSTNALCPQPLLAWTETWLCLKEIAFPEAFSSGGCFLSHSLWTTKLRFLIPIYQVIACLPLLCSSKAHETHLYHQSLAAVINWSCSHFPLFGKDHTPELMCFSLTYCFDILGDLSIHYTRFPISWPLSTWTSLTPKNLFNIISTRFKRRRHITFKILI